MLRGLRVAQSRMGAGVDFGGSFPLSFTFEKLAHACKGGAGLLRAVDVARESQWWNGTFFSLGGRVIILVFGRVFVRSLPYVKDSQCHKRKGANTSGFPLMQLVPVI